MNGVEEDHIEIKQETSVLQAVAAAHRDLSDSQTNQSEEEEEEADEDGQINSRRRERTLVRRPSYRKILTELGGHQNMIQDEREAVSGSESGSSEEISNQERMGGLAERLSGIHDRHTIHHHLPQPLRVVPSGTLLSNGGTVSSMDGVGPLGHHSSVLQFSPVSENGGYYGGHGGESGPPDESSRKREIRLQKNREAARECRRKKKEYIKCLENRVAVLENQNKALIEELKSLKELYTGGKLL